MKTLFLFGVCLAIVGSSRASSSFLGLAIAEQTNQGATEMAPTSSQHVLYIAYDGGYVEAGLPVAGIEPPTAQSIEVALRDSLRAAGYETASGTMRPSLALVFNWGYIHRDYANRLIVTPNVQARLSLVTTARNYDRTMDFLRDAKNANAGFLYDDMRISLQRLHGGRNFVVVSAYDFSDLTRGAATLLWRVKLSTEDISGNLREVLPALISGGSAYMGKSLRNPISFKATIQDDRTSMSSSEPFPLVDATKQVRPDIVYQLVRQEHSLFSGETKSIEEQINSSDDASISEWSSANPANPSRLGIPIPRALADRMLAYRRERTAFDLALNNKIRSQNSPEGRRAAIDRFNRDNAQQIAALNRESESIRGELAAASAASSYHPSDQSVANLIQQFNDLNLDMLSSDVPASQR